MMLDRRTRAIHEAGHAVMGRLLGIPCLGVMIDHGALESRNLSGVALVLPVRDPRRQCMVSVAGFCAQLHDQPDDYERALYGAGVVVADDGVQRYDPASDWATVQRCVGGNTDYFKRWTRDVLDVFADRRVWARVEKVADVVFERGHVGRRELEALVP